MWFSWDSTSLKKASEAETMVLGLLSNCYNFASPESTIFSFTSHFLDVVDTSMSVSFPENLLFS